MKKLLFFFFTLYFYNVQAQVVMERDTILMGSPFRIVVRDFSKELAENHINKAIVEIVRIENLISEWQPQTQVSEVNKNAGIKPVKVDLELINLTKTAIYFSEKTNGAFDISVISMDKIWKFDGSMTQLPTPQQIEYSKRNVGFRNIIIDEKEGTIFLAKKGMKIGFGSIGKGYAADRARAVLKSLGVQAAMVDASGDMSFFGEPKAGMSWRIGINNPYSKSGLADILKFRNASVATSGDYEKYAFIDGVRYGHIINPHTGIPSRGTISVSVIGENATTANGLSTSLMVLGVEEGLKLMKHFPDYAALFILDNKKIVKTKNYRKVLRKSRK